MIKLKRYWTIAIAIAIAIAVAYSSNVSTNSSSEQIFAIENGFGVIPDGFPLNFQGEIKLIKLTQKKIFNVAPLGEPIALGQSREPNDLLKKRSGLCYDRSRTIDKALAHLGFKTRHVYILYKEDSKNIFSALMKRGQGSHAVSEVLTSRGWMLVDSNSPWIAQTINGDPVSAEDVYSRFSEFDRAPLYFDRPYWAIPGLYSRRGQLYRHYALGFPDINWHDFLYWFFLEKLSWR